MMFYKSFQTEIVPELMKKARITPVYKKGLRSVPANYRPVTLTSYLVKTMEKIIVKSITSYKEKNHLMNPGQCGFPAGRSCLTTH